MKFDSPLIKGTFKKRYKRFFADIEIDGEIVTAHVPNTGSLKSVLSDDIPCYVTHSADPKRKLKYTLQMLKPGKSWVGINTQLPNKLVREAFDNKKVSHWANYQFARNEVKIHDKTRVDLVLGNHTILRDAKKIGSIKELEATKEKFHFVEIKNVTLKSDEFAQFPDAVSTRAQKHIEELAQLTESGHSAEFVFVVQRNDCHSFLPAVEIDPKYNDLFWAAQKKGVKMTVFICDISKKEIVISGNTIPIGSPPKK